MGRPRKNPDAPTHSPSRWVHFTEQYDHTWPSRAMTKFRAGYRGRVKGSVAEAAIAAGKAEEITDPTPAALDGAEKAQ